jgi:hypothetical protein
MKDDMRTRILCGAEDKSRRARFAYAEERLSHKHLLELEDTVEVIFRVEIVG